MDDYRLLIDLHRQGHRQGPGGDAESELALNLAMVDRNARLAIADIGCGTGASTLMLARLLNKAHITAVDFLQDFLDVLNREAERAAVGAFSGSASTAASRLSRLSSRPPHPQTDAMAVA